MATSEAPDPIFFSSAEEFQSRERYVPRLACSHEELAYLVGKYSLPRKKWIKCGLDDCTREHGLGFVYAKVTGEESHCGVDCGRNKFGLKWNEVMARFNASRKALDRKRLLENFQAEANDIVSFADKYLAEAEEVKQEISSLVRKYFEPAPDLLRALLVTAKNGGQIQIANYSAKRLRSELGYGRSGVDLITIAEVKHAHVLLESGDIVSCTAAAVRSTRALQKLDVSALSKEDLAYHSKKFQDAREQLNKAGRFIEASKKFLRPANIKTLRELRRLFPSNQGGKVAKCLDEFDAYCDSLDAGTVSPHQNKQPPR